MENGNASDVERPVRRRKQSRIGLQTVAIVLVLMGICAMIAIIHGLNQGWLLPTWTSLTDAQGAIIGGCVTLYAAALAATIGPLIFTGQISSMQAATDLTLSAIEHQVQRLTEQLEHVRKLVRQTEQTLEGGQETLFQPEKALLRLEGLREDATALAQQVVEKSNKWATTKEKTRRKWPGRKPYYKQLSNLGFITEDQRDHFCAISDTRLIKLAEITPEKVQMAEQQFNDLKQSLGQV